jgi:alpha-beta hydrolase superfamily lysophospholipase
VREALSRIGPSLPLRLVGFSNGGALAMTMRSMRSRTRHSRAATAWC